MQVFVSYWLCFVCILLSYFPSFSLLRRHFHDKLVHRARKSHGRGHMVFRLNVQPPSSSSTIPELIACVQSMPLRRRALDYLVDGNVVKELNAGQIKTVLAAIIDTEAEENLITFCNTLCKANKFHGHLLYLALHLANKKGSLGMTSTLFDVAVNYDFTLTTDMLNKILEVFLTNNQASYALPLLEDMHKGRYGFTGRTNANTFDIVVRFASQVDSNNFLVQFCNLAASLVRVSRSSYVDYEDDTTAHKGHSREYRDLLESLLCRAFQLCHYTDDLSAILDLLPLLRAHLSLSTATLDTCYALAIQTFLHSLHTPYWQLLSKEQAIAQVVGGLDQGVMRPLLSRFAASAIVGLGEGDRLSPLLHDLVLRYLAYRNNIDALGGYLHLLSVRPAPRPSPLVVMEVYETLGRWEGKKVEEIRAVWDKLLARWGVPVLSYDAPLTTMLSPSSIRSQASKLEERDNLGKSLTIIGQVRCDLDVLIRRKSKQARNRSSTYISHATHQQARGLSLGKGL